MLQQVQMKKWYLLKQYQPKTRRAMMCVDVLINVKEDLEHCVSANPQSEFTLTKTNSETS